MQTSRLRQSDYSNYAVGKPLSELAKQATGPLRKELHTWKILRSRLLLPILSQAGRHGKPDGLIFPENVKNCRLKMRYPKIFRTQSCSKKRTGAY